MSILEVNLIGSEPGRLSMTLGALTGRGPAGNRTSRSLLEQLSTSRVMPPYPAVQELLLLVNEPPGF